MVSLSINNYSAAEFKQIQYQWLVNTGFIHKTGHCNVTTLFYLVLGFVTWHHGNDANKTINLHRQEQGQNE
jgi:hypothetical protein